MRAETIGGRQLILNNRVLFYQGNVLVDAVFDRMSVMSAAQLRELAGLLAASGGQQGQIRLRCKLIFRSGLSTRLSIKRRRNTFWVRSL
jgi:hypothetical protein